MGVLFAALAGAAGGAVGAGLSLVIGRRLEPKPKWLGFVPIVCAMLAILVARGAERGAGRDIMSELDAGQNVSLLKTYYREDYAKLERQVDALPQTVGRTELASVVDQALGEVANRQRPKADDETSRQMYMVARAEGAALKALSSAACAAFMDGVGRSEDLEKVMTPALRAQDMAASRQLLIQTATKPAPPVAPMSAQALAELSVPALSKLSDADQDVVIQILREGRAPRDDHEYSLMCDFSLAQADQILAGPPAVAGARVRAFWALSVAK